MYNVLIKAVVCVASGLGNEHAHKAHLDKESGWVAAA